jgi:methionine biosynthesis protein MetW
MENGNNGNRESFSYDEIISLIEPGSTVLDLGCGDGTLLCRLITEKNVHGRGVDIEESMVLHCISRGLSVFQGNLEEGLRDYQSNSYDYVILNRTLQMIHNPVMLMKEMVRVGNQVIVNFPNFGYVLNRMQLFFQGRMPVNKNIPYQWYDTPNIHFCTRKDFMVLCKELGLEVTRIIDMRRSRIHNGPLPNLMATEICFMIRGGNTAERNNL